jgi:hypothetical protein
MSEQQARSRTHKPGHGLGTSRKIRGSSQTPAEATWMLHQAEFENKVRQSINTTLSWYDYLTRSPGSETPAVDRK